MHKATRDPRTENRRNALGAFTTTNFSVTTISIGNMTIPFDSKRFVAELEQLKEAYSWKDTTSQHLAKCLDDHDELAALRQEYFLPTMEEVSPTNTKETPFTEPCLYLCGNSLGPLARRSKQYLEEEIDAWKRKAVLGHWDHPYNRPWTRCEEAVSVLMSDIVGAKPKEVVAMGTLTANLHVMLSTFYRPGVMDLANGHLDVGSNQKKRHKIIYEGRAFPSDQYALASVVALAGFDPKTSLIGLEAREGEKTLRTEDIVETLEREAATGELGLLLLGDVQYLSGQMFDVPVITKRARELGVIVGWDLAHAFANVPLALHDWDVDFAVWCTYKYGSSGPGGIAGIFVNERWGDIGFSTSIGRDIKQSHEQPGAQGVARPAGWWGHEKSTRFTMPDSFRSMQGAAGWQQSNPSALDMASLLGSLQTLALAPGLLTSRKKKSDFHTQYQLEDFPNDFASQEYASRRDEQSGTLGWGYIMPALRQKSQQLTAYLEHLLLYPGFLPEEANVAVVTPLDPQFRGSQLSICLSEPKARTQSKIQPSSQAESNGKGSVPTPVAHTTFVGRVHKHLEEKFGVVCDVRNPDMLRLAPVAQFSSYNDVWRAANALRLSVLSELNH